MQNREYFEINQPSIGVVLHKSEKSVARVLAIIYLPLYDVSLSEAHSSPMLASRTGTKSATPSPVAPGSRRKTLSVSSQEWPTNEDDIDRLVSMHHNRSSLSSLGVKNQEEMLMHCNTPEKCIATIMSTQGRIQGGGYGGQDLPIQFSIQGSQSEFSGSNGS
ncbi:hypothetical protein YQE_06501, partial [Dendroctonus ponderosae]